MTQRERNAIRVAAVKPRVNFALAKSAGTSVITLNSNTRLLAHIRKQMVHAQ